MFRLNSSRRASSNLVGANFLKRTSPPKPVADNSEPDLKATTTASREIFGMRRAPRSLYDEGMKSASLSEHPLTLRALETDARSRRRDLAEVSRRQEADRREEEARLASKRKKSGSWTDKIQDGEKAPQQQEQRQGEAAVREQASEEDELSANASVVFTEYRLCIFFLTLGFITAHVIVYRIYYPEDVRLPYQLDTGFAPDLLRRKDELADLDEFVGLRVMNVIVDPKRSALKSK